MKSVVRTAMIVGLLAGVAVCRVAMGGPGEFDGGDTYQGNVSARVIEPGAGRDGKRDVGTGSAEFIATGNGNSRLVVKASIRRTHDAGFVMEGRANGSSWSGRAGGLSLVVDARGNISGGGLENKHRIVFGGRATDERMDLRVETIKLAQTEPEVLPVGTRIVFDYDLKRTGDKARAAKPAATASADKSQKNAGTCKRIVWKTRNVTTPLGGMSMIQVPHCLD